MEGPSLLRNEHEPWPRKSKASADDAPADTDWSDFAELVFERGGCLGTCPVYWIVVLRDGTVHWHGEYFVQVEGERSWKISPARIERLREHLRASEFGSHEMGYGGMTDAPSSTTTVTTVGGMQREAYFYHGQLLRDPEQVASFNRLKAMERGIDRIVGTGPYVGKRKW